jgi:hypothetical protein
MPAQFLMTSSRDSEGGELADLFNFARLSAENEGVAVPVAYNELGIDEIYEQ